MSLASGAGCQLKRQKKKRQEKTKEKNKAKTKNFKKVIKQRVCVCVCGKFAKSGRMFRQHTPLFSSLPFVLRSYAFFSW
ncbi:hypothetical protein TRSC58_07668 [Trypanosoma rangeli SC58]|uniref:Uncharacterized protein n=1 Tax=Trypanosoma rangeli SC58 TaxID=429131 RepID=A0A061IUQ6_TRYRA|nr:hypothetical protein TRSC58_07668 [Trypanosoma rangeli SC58]